MTMRARTVRGCSSFGKIVARLGWKVAECIAPSDADAVAEVTECSRRRGSSRSAIVAVASRNYGTLPKDVPKVTWTIATQATDRVVGEIPVVAKQLVGHVDNAACPAMTPPDAKSPVPVLTMFGGGFGGNGFPRG